MIVNGAFLGSATALATQLDSLVATVGAAPLVRNTEDFAFKAGMMNWYDCGNRTVAQCHTVGYNPEAQLPRTSFIIDRSRLFSGSLPAVGTDQLLAAFDADRRAGQARFAQSLALGGRVNTLARSATAYVHRDSQFTANLTVALPTSTPSTDERDAAQAWIDAGFAVLDPYSTHETYQNYVDPHLADWRRAYYAENYPRLVAVKRAVDPHHFFSFAQSIG